MIKEIFDGRYAVDDAGGVYSLRNNRGALRSNPRLLKVQTCPAGEPHRLSRRPVGLSQAGLA
jgi:hypothetical protein